METLANLQVLGWGWGGNVLFIKIKIKCFTGQNLENHDFQISSKPQNLTNFNQKNYNIV